MGHHGQGRRKIKPEKIDAAKRAIVASLLDGASRLAACPAAKVGRSTFYNWLDEDEAFAKQVAKAEVWAVETMESVIYAAGLKSEEDPRYLRAAIRWLEQHGGWQRSNVNGNFDLSQCTDEELERMAKGEHPIRVIVAGWVASRTGSTVE